MAAFEDLAVSRKRMTTYGKAARRRIPEYSLASLKPRSQTPEMKESGLLASRSPSIPPLETSQKLKNFPKGPASRNSSPASPIGADVFDVPSSDDEALITPRLAHNKAAPKALPNRIPKISSETLAAATEDAERRKRMKLSPTRPTSQRLVRIKPISKSALLKTTVPPPKQHQKPLERAGQTPTVVARVKPTTVQRKPDLARTPKRLSPVPPKALAPSTPSPALSDAEMMDVDSPGKSISPRAMQMWQDLLKPVGDNEADATVESYRSEAVAASAAGASGRHISGKALSKAAGDPKYPQSSPRKLPRRRLIDSLVEQATHQDDTREDDSDSSKSDMIPEISPTLITSNLIDISRNQSHTQEVPNQSVLSASQGSQNAGLKFTYSRQRSMLAEEDLMKQLALDMPSQPAQVSQNRKPRRGSIPTLQPLQSFLEEEEDDDGVAGIRSVHELRQAGANNRFLDEIEDLLDRIGSPTSTPSSMRRSGLLDLAGKIADKNFIRQFRANGVEQRLFVHMGRETDLVSGFVLVSVLMAVLADANIMPHVVAQLRNQGVARLLSRLVDSQAPIIASAKERKSNMSKVAQSLLAEHHGFLIKIPLWEELQPRIISPRTMALKCLEMMVRQTREAGNAGDIISKELTTKLFSILKYASDENSWDLPSGQLAIDFCLALSVLESHSITAMTLQDEKIWTSDYLPIVADILEISLTRPIDDFGVLQILILRLTLNVTNNNSNASDVFAIESLMAALGQVIVVKFNKISRFLTEEDLSQAVDHLILALGVMINFAEWSSSARESFQKLQGKAPDPLDSMIRFFVDNQERTSMAESVEESQKNVAFGYLSVLLGYLSLLPAISERIRIWQPRKTIRPLVASIEEFIIHHKTVDSLFKADEDGHNAHAGLTNRLQNLVDKLGDTNVVCK